VRRQRTYFKLTLIVSVSLVIILLLGAGIKDIYWIALIFTLVWFVYSVYFFVSTFFSRKALKMRKSNYKKPLAESNAKEPMASPTKNENGISI
jgi:hypothetical protein